MNSLGCVGVIDAKWKININPAYDSQTPLANVSATAGSGRHETVKKGSCEYWDIRSKSVSVTRRSHRYHWHV